MKLRKKQNIIILLKIFVLLVGILIFIYLNQEIPVFEYSEESNISNTQIHTDTNSNSDTIPIGRIDIIETKQPTTTRFNKLMTELSDNQIFILVLFIISIVVNLIMIIKNVFKMNTERNL